MEAESQLDIPTKQQPSSSGNNTTHPLSVSQLIDDDDNINNTADTDNGMIYDDGNDDDDNSAEKGDSLSNGSVVGVNGSFETGPVESFVGDTFLNEGISDGIDVGVDGVASVGKNDSLVPEVEKNDVLPSGVEENDGLASGVVEEEGSVVSGVNKNDSIASGVGEDESSEVPGVEKNESLASGVGEDESSEVSGVEKNESFASGVGEDESSEVPGVEKNESFASGVGEDESSEVSGVENNESFASEVVEKENSEVSGVENNESFASEVVEKESSEVSGVENDELFASGVVEEESSEVSGVEKSEALASGVEENASVQSVVAEENDSLASGVFEQNDSLAPGVVEENDSLASGVVEDGGAELGNEGDAVVDSINVDVVEVVRQGVAVVGIAEGGESTEVELKGVEGEEVKPIDETGSVEESLNADVAEAADEETAVVEESDNAVAGDVEQPAPVEEPKAPEADLVKSTSEEDSVVDEIHVDPVEAVISGMAVVGSSENENMGVEVQKVVAPEGENVAVENEFEPLVSANEKPVTDNDVESAEHEERVEGDQIKQEDTLQDPLSGEDVKPEIDAESKESQPADALEEISGGGEPQLSADVVEEEVINDRSDADVLLDGGVDASESGKSQLQEQAEPTEAHSQIGSEADTGHDVESSERCFVPQGGVETQIVSEPEEEADSDEEGEEKEMFDSAALAALLKAATSAGSDSGTITISAQDASRLFSVERPAGLGSSLRPLRPATRPANSNLVNQPNLAATSEANLSEEERKKLQQMHQLRIKFLRLVQRVGFSEEDSIAAQVLYRLALLAGRLTSPAFSLENAKQTAVQLEAQGKDDLDFSLTVLVLGKAGVGKSATINSIFGEEKVKVNAFEQETTSVQEVSGVIDGVKIRVIDAPGLRSSGIDQGFNRKILASVKKLTKKYPPDVMLYVDRLDTQTRDLNDLPVLRTITSSLGSSIWRSAIVTLTHAACAPPDGPSGSPLSYEVFVANRSHIVQQFIGQAVGDLRLMNPSLMNPVSLVENHPACRKNREGQRVLPNGQAWRPQLLLLCYSLKILSEANASLKSQDPFDHRKLFGFRARSAPLPYLLSTMLQPRAHPKLSPDQGGDGVDSDVDLDDLSDSEEEDEYEQLPPFKPLRKSQIAKLSRDQRKAYFEEYDYRVKLLQRKQWREECKRMREMKKGKSYDVNLEDYDAENEAPAAVPVPLPDMVLPPSFDSDSPAYRYRFLEPTSQFLARPVLDSHGWDHDCGYDGVNLEQNLGIAGRFPASVTLQVTKDKKESNVHLDSAVSAKHGEHGSTLVGFDVQTIGKQSAYIIRGETKSKLLKKNKAGAGVAVTFLGENVATGVKVEDQLSLGKRLVLVGSAGTVRSQKDAAYGANMEVRLREADHPIGQDQSSLSLSLMKWRGDLAIGGNLQSQVSVGRNSKMAVRVSLNNKLSGQISVRTSSSDHLQLALAGLVPIALSIYRNFKPSVGDNYSLY